MPVLTRSSKKEEKKKKFVNKDVRAEQKPPPKENKEEQEIPEDDDFIDDDDSDEEDIFKNDYELPKSIRGNRKLLKKSEKIIESLEKDEPSMEKILKSKIRFKRRKEMFEWFFIYSYTFPNSEDRVLLKEDLNRRLRQYEKEFIEFEKNKEKFLEMEKVKKEESDIYYWKKKLLEIQTNKENRILLFQKYNELESREYHDEEYYKLLYWFRKALLLPYDNIITIKTENTMSLLKELKRSMDEELFGMEKVKEQILLYVHNKLMFPNNKSQCLGLIGPPGVGKTSIALCLSRILNIPFEQISLGGVSHADYLRGHDFTFVGSKPGVIASSLMKMKVKNGILFLDEYEKISENKDVVNSLLHITDTSQNMNFKDNFFGEILIDLSKIWYICSMNEKPSDVALSDRIFYIKCDGYSQKEKIEIIKHYLLPSGLINIGLTKNDIEMDDKTIVNFIEQIGSDEKGIRLLKQGVNSIISKVSFLVHNQQEIKMSFSLPSSYYPMKYPVKIETKMLEFFLKEFRKEINPSITNLYI